MVLNQVDSRDGEVNKAIDIHELEPAMLVTHQACLCYLVMV